MNFLVQIIEDANFKPKLMNEAVKITHLKLIFENQSPEKGKEVIELIKRCGEISNWGSAEKDGEKIYLLKIAKPIQIKSLIGLKKWLTPYHRCLGSSVTVFTECIKRGITREFAIWDEKEIVLLENYIEESGIH